MFSRPNVKQLFEKYTLVRLYTDIVPAAYYAPEAHEGLTRKKQQTDAKANQTFQVEQFGDARLPLYVILEPTGNNGEFREVARYDEGKINSVEAFADFLRKNAGNGAAKATARANP